MSSSGGKRNQETNSDVNIADEDSKRQKVEGGQGFSSTSRGHGGPSSEQDGSKRILFYPFAKEHEREGPVHQAAKQMFDSLTDASAKDLVEAVGKAVDATLFEHYEATRAPGGQPRLPSLEAKPPLPTTGKATVDEIAVHFEKMLRRMNIDPFFGGDKNDSMMKAILYYILPPFVTISQKNAEAQVKGKIEGLAIVLTSPSAPGSNPLKTVTGREIGKLVAIVTVVDKELRSVLPGEECPSPMPPNIFVLDLLGFNAKKGGDLVLPKLKGTHDTASLKTETTTSSSSSSSSSLVAPSLSATLSSTAPVPLVIRTDGLLLELVEAADGEDYIYVDSEDEEAPVIPRTSSSSAPVPSETGEDHSARITALGSKALDPLARIMAEQSRNADPTLKIVPSTRKIKLANANWSTPAGIKAEQTLSHVCTTSRVSHSKAERVMLALAVLGWSEDALKEGLDLLGDKSELANISAGSTAFRGSAEEKQAKKQSLINQVKRQVRISRDATRLIPLTSALYAYRTELGKVLASHVRSKPLSGAKLSDAELKKPLSLTHEAMDSILRPYWENKFGSTWTEGYSNEAFNSWSSGNGMENLRRLSTAIYALSQDNPLHSLLKKINEKLRTLCSSSKESGKPKFLDSKLLIFEITKIYKANLSLTSSMRAPTFGDFNEATQYWGGSGKGTRNVLGMETNDITEILNPLFTKIISALWTIRKGFKLVYPLSEGVLRELDAATLKVLQKEDDFSSITELPEGFANEVYKFASSERGKGQLNAKLTSIPLF
jgi:hypothetical protein